MHCSLQDRGVKVASGGTGFVNSAGPAGPIRTGDGSFDAPERQNDDGGGHVAPRATCRRVKPSKNVVSGLQPKREVAGSPNLVAASRRIRSCRNDPEWPKLGGWETLAKPTGQPEVGSSDSGDTALERSG